MVNFLIKKVVMISKHSEKGFLVLHASGTYHGCLSTPYGDDLLSAGVFMRILQIDLLLSQYVFVMSADFWNCVG